MAGLNKKQSLYCFSKYIKGTLENYFASTDREIKSEHIPRFFHSDAVRMISNSLNYLAEDSEVHMYLYVDISNRHYCVYANKMQDLILELFIM